MTARAHISVCICPSSILHCNNGWDHAKSELRYHVGKLKEIRALYHSRLQVLANNYCYLRDLQAHRWQTFGIWELQMSLGVLSPPPLSPHGDQFWRAYQRLFFRARSTFLHSLQNESTPREQDLLLMERFQCVGGSEGRCYRAMASWGRCQGYRR
jgi:hypothetical protein